MTSKRIGIAARIAVGACLIVIAAAGVAAEETGMAGFWKGSIALPGHELEVMLEIAPGDTWSASLFIPSQGVRDVPMTGVAIEGNSMKAVIPGIPGEPTFAGQLAEDGQTISGDFSQGGQSLPFSLTRSAKPEELSVDIYAEFKKPGVPGQGLAGTWNGLVEAGPHRMRLVLALAADESGGLSGELTSLDQNNAKITVGEVSLDGSAVTISVPQVAAQFDGTLDEQQAEIVGTWKQGGQEMPLTFRRK